MAITGQYGLVNIFPPILWGASSWLLVAARFSDKEPTQRRGIDRRMSGLKDNMRTIIKAGVLAATVFAGGSALAQGSYVHHSFCLKTGSGQECAM
jgi:hypothetical protein